MEAGTHAGRPEAQPAKALSNGDQRREGEAARRLADEIAAFKSKEEEDMARSDETTRRLADENAALREKQGEEAARSAEAERRASQLEAAYELELWKQREQVFFSSTHDIQAPEGACQLF